MPRLARTHGQPSQPLGQRTPTRSAPSRAHPLVPHSSGHPPKSSALHILLPCGEPSPHRQPLPDHLPPLVRYGQLALLDLLSILLAFAGVQFINETHMQPEGVLYHMDVQPVCVNRVVLGVEALNS